jgi:HD-GYP domain-containing protein (c-di-GMP phosphodiesterase class II)
MHLVPVSVESIKIGQPLPFPLMDKDGVLLAKKSFVIGSRDDLLDFSNRGGGLFIDVADSEAHHRAYVGQLNGMVRDGRSLGEIAGAKITIKKTDTREDDDTEHPDWLDLQVQGNMMLRDSQSAHFMERLERLHHQLDVQSHRNPDGTLFALIHLSTTETRMYSATHAMLVSVMCGLAAREVLNWPADVESMVCKAALTMNLGMTELQDRLASQTDPVTPTQRRQIDEHPTRSMEKLMALGVTDAIWLQAVAQHHTQAPGPLRTRTPAERLARLIQRADMFAARLAPRASRVPVAPAAAMQACYFDENRQIDEAGAALIKAVGIYQPGSFVRLATDEVGVVVKRGLNTTTPKVAVLINRNGMPTVEPMVRDTSLADYKVVSSVPHRDVRVQINLERLLPLTVPVKSDRPW